MEYGTLKKLSLIFLSFAWGVWITINIEMYIFGMNIPLPVLLFMFATFMVFMFTAYLEWHIRRNQPTPVDMKAIPIGGTAVSGGKKHRTEITRTGEEAFELAHFHRKKKLWTKRVKWVNDNFEFVDIAEVEMDGKDSKRES